MSKQINYGIVMYGIGKRDDVDSYNNLIVVHTSTSLLTKHFKNCDYIDFGVPITDKRILQMYRELDAINDDESLLQSHILKVSSPLGLDKLVELFLDRYKGYEHKIRESSQYHTFRTSEDQGKRFNEDIRFISDLLGKSNS